MALEIERKFLVIPDRLPIRELPPGDIYEQGYLSIDPCVRIRLGRAEAWLTIKGNGTVVRAEYEYNVPYEEAEAMLTLAKVSLRKIRYKYEHRYNQPDDEPALLWEIDQFLGRHQGLWLAEVNLTSAEQAFTCPDWVGDEVTEDSTYSNASLALHGLPNPKKHTR